jgi:hypothetical protein
VENFSFIRFIEKEMDRVESHLTLQEDIDELFGEPIRRVGRAKEIF